MLVNNKGKIYKGLIQNNSIFILKRGREKKIHSEHFVIINKNVYNALKNEAHHHFSENVGVLYGHVFGSKLAVETFARIPPHIRGLKHSERFLRPRGGKLATSDVEKYCSLHPGIIGFYHGHATRDALNFADKKELIEMIKFPHLHNPSKLHILARMWGIVPGLSKTTIEPIAYYRHNRTYKEIPIIIR